MFGNEVINPIKMDIHVDGLLLLIYILEQVSANEFGYIGTTLVPLPRFIPTQRNFTYKLGQLARLECAVDNLSTKKVIWRKGSESNPLTIGKRTFVDDKRIIIEHTPLQQNWNLLIKHVRIDDEGMYECQVSSQARNLRHHVYLTIEVPKSRSTFIPGDPLKPVNDSGVVYDIRISGEKYIEKGQKINLTCNATGEDHAPDDLDWFKNGDKLSTSYGERIFIHKRLSLTSRTIVSNLEIHDADMDDAGVYICRTSGLQVTSLRVNVLNAHTNNVKRHKSDKYNLVGSKADSSVRIKRRDVVLGLAVLTLWTTIT